MTRAAPAAFSGGRFALKGGTAINLFFRDMPRLSVDLDLVFPDQTLIRADALKAIGDEMRAIEIRLRERGYQVHVINSPGVGETKLLVRDGPIEIKIEVNFVIRGTVHPIAKRAISARAQDILLADLELPVLSLEDVYGGKLVAALDRQHPRDLFDVMQLYAHEGLTPGIRRAFVVYLASHDRPVHEVLAPQFRDVSFDYHNHFVGMTEESVPLQALLETRERLTKDILTGLDAAERAFLLSLVGNTPDWSAMGIDHLQHMPALKWKLVNLEKLQVADPGKFALQRTALEKILR